MTGKRFYREEDGDIYDRSNGKTIEVITEISSPGYYEVKDKDGWHYIDKQNIEEER